MVKHTQIGFTAHLKFGYGDLCEFLPIIVLFSDQIEAVSISCSEDLTVETKQVDKTLCWDFRVQTEVRLECFTPLFCPRLRDALSHLLMPPFTTLIL